MKESIVKLMETFDLTALNSLWFDSHFLSQLINIQLTVFWQKIKALNQQPCPQYINNSLHLARKYPKL